MGSANTRTLIGKAKIEFWVKRNGIIPSPDLPYNEWEILVFLDYESGF